MPRIADPNRKLRGKLNLTIHPEIRDFAEQLAFKRRRSVSQLFEDLVEAESALRDVVQEGDVLIVQGAGDVDDLARKLAL